VTNKKMAPRVAARKAERSKTSEPTNHATVTDYRTFSTGDTTRRERAERNVHKYISWKSVNTRAYSMLCDVAKTRAEAGGVVSGGDLLRWLRSHDVVNDLGRPCRPNNDYAAPLIRDICLHNPVVGPHVETRTGVYDEIGLVDMVGGDER
jgi:hypothetical protein